ncbi:MAG: hypothetical protein M3347_13660 [Armatimonadota bacterium]|nr:hypothetical protein [Armatimonadota bacterium]
MIRRKKMDCLVGSLAVSVLALVPMVALAEGTTTTGSTSTTTSTTTTTGTDTTGTMGTMGTMGATGSTTGSTDTSMSMSSQPVQASGTVERYYTDRSGYVTAADIRTAEGTQMVHFAPGMGTRLQTAYPVGGTAQVWVTPSGMGSGHWNVVGWGATMPASGFNAPYTATDIDMLEGEPYIVAGTKMVTVSGKLSNTITDDMGNVLALVLDARNGGGNAGIMMPGTMPGTGGMAGHMWGSSGYLGSIPVSGPTFIRVPREFRNLNPNAGGNPRITALYKGAFVEATGYPEAPMYGVVSIYPNRVAANAISVDGESVAYGGIAPMHKRGKPLIGLNINLPLMGSARPAPESSTHMGYTPYDPGGMGTTTESTSGMTPTTGTGTGTDTGTTGGTTGGTGTGTSTGGTDTGTGTGTGTTP